jgi:hypothetical protein
LPKDFEEEGIIFVVHMIARTGQLLPRAVMKGLIDNDCEPLIASSWTNYLPTKGRINRENQVKNWNTAFSFPYGDMFICMQNNIILEPGIIHRAVNLLTQTDVVTLPVVQAKKPQHGVFLMRKAVIDKVPMKYVDERFCALCRWINDVSLHFKVLHIQTPVLQRANRTEIKRRI